MIEPVQVTEFAGLATDDFNIIDTRETDVFKQGYIPGAVHVPLKGIKDWSAGLFKKDEPLLLITEVGQEEASAKALKDAGYTNLRGYLDGGITAWTDAGNKVDMIIDVESDELMMDIPFDDHLIVVDVRKPIEYAEGHLKDAVNIPLAEINDPVKIAQFSETDNLYLHCGGGTRSVIAASVLKKHGVHNLRNVAGGWKKIKEEPKAEIVKEPDVLN